MAYITCAFLENLKGKNSEMKTLNVRSFQVSPDGARSSLSVCAPCLGGFMQV